MKVALYVSLLSLSLSSCAPPANSIGEVQKSATFTAPYSTVWDALTEVVAEQGVPIESIERESGLLSTGRFQPGNGYGLPTVSNFLAVYGEYNQAVTFLLRENGSGSRLTITVNGQQWEGNMSKRWIPCKSTGKYEAEIFEAIRAKI